jgi:hypothetical protein
VQTRFRKILQPGDGLQIQVVGRFVQEQYVRVAEQGLGQQHPHLVAALQLPHPLVAKFLGDAQAVQQHRRLGLGLVAVHFGERRLQFGRTDPVRLGKIVLGVERLALEHHVMEPLVPHDDGIENRFLIKGGLVLPEHGDPFAGADRDLPLVGADFA